MSDGTLVAEPITNGTVSGPATNTTITGDIATPSIYNNGFMQAPVIQAWGLTSDGFGFVISELGIGSPNGQVTRIVSQVHHVNSRQAIIYPENRCWWWTLV